MSFFKKQQANVQKAMKQPSKKKTNKTLISYAEREIKGLEQQKKELENKINNDKAQIKEIENKINRDKAKIKELENETFAPSVISPCSFQLMEFVIAVLFLVLLIKIYSRLSVFSSINEFYTTRPDTKTFN